MDTQSWQNELDRLAARIGAHFARSESRRLARSYLVGLLSNVERKNGWQLSEALGLPNPYALQQFLYRGGWSADEVRDEMRSYVIEELSDRDAVLVIDETGFLKKGTRSVGVQRQYSGTAGRIANCQVGVFLVYAGSAGATFLDRALYLPESWTEDRDRCRQAGVPETVGFATKPALATAMLTRALDAAVPARWVTGDSVYGDVWALRDMLERRGVGYVLAVTRKMHVQIGWQRVPVGDMLADLPTDGWSRLSVGDGAKGPRVYDWCRVEVLKPMSEGWRRWLLVRRSVADPDEVTAYICFAPDGTSLETLAQVAGRRWTVEMCFEQAKGEVGLDHYEVRSWGGWYRHVTLACLAHALLAVLRSRAPADGDPVEKGGPQPIPKGSLAAFKSSRGLSSA